MNAHSIFEFLRRAHQQNSDVHVIVHRDATQTVGFPFRNIYFFLAFNLK